ncbi:SusC/RagA family TonB-linked outer membrane protein [Moheibacter lacus]|uniref:SusC/RagA family TonB-linked outer membrane protein n=1 Tax=Moheibacter lacus TaxID=2745851 RepID=A0A838ZR89_9FLAO|nr:SusC/RagA family TonB-linked outer membrane protein [Moheibacter lacus]MBA5628872.1 SusC/RagA family TonB-linked outer membrane protein [Moheibacter lacus]
MRTKFAFISALFLLFIGQVVFAQVTGTVQDDYGPVVDAEVTVRGGDASAITDENGSFSIDAQVGNVLVVTDAMGTSKDFTVNKLNMGTLTFGADVELDVVTITKSIFDPGAVSNAGVTRVDAQVIETQTPSLSVDQMLAGKISGLNSVGQQGGSPGSVGNVVIRGAVGLNGGVKSPLYIVNGAYLNEDDVNSINPNDIESIDVLKEASQLAVYGSRGANGVVIIKTKSAKKGQSIINYRTSFGYSELMDLNNVEVMGSRQLLEFQNQLSSSVDDEGMPTGVGIARTPEEIEALSQINTDWNDEYTKGGFLTSHYLSIANAGDRSSSNFSVGYDQNTGNIIYYKGFERITSSFNNVVQVNDRFSYGVNVSGSYTERDNPRDRYNGQNPFFNILRNTPYSTVYQMDEDGNPVLDQYGDPVFNQAVSANSYNALDEMKYTYRSQRNFRLFGSGYLALEVFKNVTARTTFGATYDRTQVESFGQPRSHLSNLLGYNGYKSDSSSDRLDYNWRNEVTYGNSWGRHNLSVTAATEYINENNYYSLINSRGFPNNFQNVQVLATVVPGDTYTNRWLITRFGYLGSVAYDFGGKYFVNGYVRRDGTSLAGFDNQYGTFWGASLGWDVAKESFFDSQRWLNNLILRASYGEVGDDSGLEVYSNLSAIAQATHTGSATPISYPDGIANDDVTWETNAKLNLGFDFGMFNRRLTGTFAWFQDNRRDFLFDQALAAEAGGYSVSVNAGELQTNGFEIELNYDILRIKDGLNLSVYGNFTNIGYEVKELTDGLNQIFPSGAFESMVHEVGQEPFTFFMVRYAGVNPDNGNAQYYDIDGNITEKYDATDAVTLDGKSPFPKYYGGFGLTAEYKGFNLRADFNYQGGNYLYNNTYELGTELNPDNDGYNYFVDAANYWQNPGDTGVFQKPSVNGFEYSDQFLEKGDYILFRTLELGYTFKEDLFKNLPVRGMRVYGQIQNLALWTDYHGNPIQGTGASESSNVQNEGYVSGAFSLYSYPLTRAYSLGINLTF